MQEILGMPPKETAREEQKARVRMAVLMGIAGGKVVENTGFMLNPWGSGITVGGRAIP